MAGPAAALKRCCAVASSKVTVPVGIRRMVADTEVLRRVVIWGLQTGVRFRRPRVADRLLVNSFPKAGTHLVARALDLSELVRYSWRHLAPKEDPDEGEVERRLAAEGVAENIAEVPLGHYATSHLGYDPLIERALTDAEFGVVLVLRDPRALLVSNVRYVMKRHRHFLHQRFSTLYSNDDERVRALLNGFPNAAQWGLGRAPFADLLARYVPWLEASTVHLRFEDLAGPRAGGTRGAQVQALDDLYSVISGSDSSDMAHRLADDVWSQKSITFRKGQIDEWRGALSPSVLAEVECQLAPVARLLGYEFD